MPIDLTQPPRLIVCLGEKCNHAGVAAALYQELEEILDAADPLHPPFKLRTANCLDQCDRGPSMVLHPGNRRFDRLDAEKLRHILAEYVFSPAEGDVSNEG